MDRYACCFVCCWFSLQYLLCLVAVLGHCCEQAGKTSASRLVLVALRRCDCIDACARSTRLIKMVNQTGENSFYFHMLDGGTVRTFWLILL
jgi:hypothetical protein